MAKESTIESPVHRPGPEQTTSGTQVQSPDPQRWVALVVILAAGFMDLLDTTIVNVALPDIQHNLHAQYAELEWVVAAYAMAFAAVLITGGRLGDIYGRKRLFLAGVAGFTLASVLAGVSTTAAALIGSRVLEGAAAALMVPQILSIVHVTFPQSERGKVFGMYGGIVGSASVAGPIIGGLLVQANIGGLGWRPIFLINIPVGIVAVLAGRKFITESKSPSAPRLDLLGMVLVVVAILLLEYPLAEGRQDGWPGWTFIMLAASIPVFAIFIAYERKRTASVGSPLVVLRLFKDRAFDAGLSVWLLFNVALGGFFLVWTLYMQVGLGWTPLHAGVTSVAFAFGAAPAAGLSVQVLTPRFGRKVLMAGALLNAVGFYLYHWHVTSHTLSITSWQMILPLVVSGAGFGFVVAPVTDLVISGVPRDDAGSASGVFSTFQQLGMALGVALAGVLFFAQIAGNSDHAANQTSAELRTAFSAGHVPAASQSALLTGFTNCLHDRSSESDPTATPPSCDAVMAAATKLPAKEAAAVEPALTKAMGHANGRNFAHSFGVALMVADGILIAVFLGMFSLPKKVRADFDPTDVVAA